MPQLDFQNQPEAARLLRALTGACAGRKELKQEEVRCQVIPPWIQDESWGGWIRDEQMKLACASPGRLGEMFSRGL